MQIRLANPRGFCAGVDRAIEIVNRALEVFGPPVYVRHEVVHNRYVVEDLRERGAVFVEELDEILGAHARNWRVSRMTAVDRNVLRLAVYELRDSEIPVAVVIDEAVELARRFGADSSPAFVNGVLDAVAREVRAA